MERYSGIFMSKTALERNPESEKDILESQDPKAAYYYAKNVIKGRWPEAEDIIRQSFVYGLWYVQYILKERWPEFEPQIAQDTFKAYEYAVATGKRFLEAEPYIMKDPEMAFHYANAVLRNKWPEAEPYIKQDEYYWSRYKSLMEDIGRDLDTWTLEEGETWGEEYSDLRASKIAVWTGPGRDPEREKEILEEEYAYGALMYAADNIQGRWPEAEPFIAKDPQVAHMYARDVVRGRFPEGEEAIASEYYYANLYAHDVLHDRFPLGEPAIMEDPGTAYLYARTIIKGRWPEAEPYIKNDLYFWDQYTKFLKEIGKDLDTWQIEEWK